MIVIYTRVEVVGMVRSAWVTKSPWNQLMDWRQVWERGIKDGTVSGLSNEKTTVAILLSKMGPAMGKTGFEGQIHYWIG